MPRPHHRAQPPHLARWRQRLGWAIVAGGSAVALLDGLARLR